MRTVSPETLDILGSVSPVGIFRTNTRGRCTYVNQTWCEFSGQPRKDALGFGWLDALHPGDRKRALRLWESAVRRGDESWNIEYRVVRPGHDIAWVAVHVVREAADDDTTIGYIGTTTDITKGKRTEAALRKSERQLRVALGERETLLRELHHRVKNNLQVVSSWLSLQLGHIADPKVQALVTESQSRIGAMAMVHEKLYQADDLTRVDLPGYLESIASSVRAAHAVPGQRIDVDVEVEVEPLALELDKAVLAGLIVNELVMNGFKHAFRGRKRGRIRVRALLSDEQVELAVTDNGIGMPVGTTLITASTLGLQIVHGLAKQPGGDASIVRRRGTTIQIAFPRAAGQQPVGKS
jgi:PAS domain S-box-containing protein